MTCTKVVPEWILMAEDTKDIVSDHPSGVWLARIILVTFLLAFILARITVLMIMSRKMPDLYLYVGGTHVHHLNYGIFLLAGVGFYLLFGRPGGWNLRLAAGLYGVGMALTFDEFGMWIHLGGSYWQRASWDAVTVLAGLFALVAFAPSLKRLRPRHWFTGVALAILIAAFFFMLVKSLDYTGKRLKPEIQRIESASPR